MFNHAETYINTINWSKRLNIELPILRDIIDELATKSSQITSLKILDLGCGPGKHLQSLTKFYPNYEFYGLDKNSDYINYGKTSISSNEHNVQFFTKDFLDDDISEFPQFDFIYSLGNSLMLMWGDQGPFKVFQNINKLLKPGGKLFFQILNSDHPRNGYFVSKIHKTVENMEYFTAKRFKSDTNEDVMNVEFITFYKKPEEHKYNFDIGKSTWKKCSSLKMREILHQFGIEIINLWGNYDKIDLKTKPSDNLLCNAEKSP